MLMTTYAEILSRELETRQSEIDRRRADLSSAPPSVDDLAEVKAAFDGLYDRAGAGTHRFR